VGECSGIHPPTLESGAGSDDYRVVLQEGERSVTERERRRRRGMLRVERWGSAVSITCRDRSRPTKGGRCCGLLGSAILCTGTLLGCTGDSLSGEQVASDARPTDSSGVETIAGYVQTRSKTTLPIGKITQSFTASGAHQIVGTGATFSTEVVSLSARGQVISQEFPPPGDIYPGDAESMNRGVLAYLTAAGLPREQVASVSDDECGISVDGDGGWTVLVSTWWSVLHRAYRGVPVVDSMANVVLGADGSSIAEEIYWPEIGPEVVQQLRDFQAMLNSPTSEAYLQFMQNLPTGPEGDGALVIRHTTWYWTGAFTAVPCYRMMLGSTAVCFDMTGHLVSLPDGT